MGYSNRGLRKSWAGQGLGGPSAGRKHANLRRSSPKHRHGSQLVSTTFSSLGATRGYLGLANLSFQFSRVFPSHSLCCYNSRQNPLLPQPHQPIARLDTAWCLLHYFRYLGFGALKCHDRVPIRTMQVERLQELVTTGAGARSSSPDTPLCRYYNSSGGCACGPLCNFRHVKPPLATKRAKAKLEVDGVQIVKHTNVSQYQVCQHFASEKGCSRGDKCRFLHVVLLPPKQGSSSSSIALIPEVNDANRVVSLPDATLNTIKAAMQRTAATGEDKSRPSKLKFKKTPC